MGRRRWHSGAVDNPGSYLGIRMKTPEGKIKDKVKALLAEHGAYQFWPVPMGFGKRTLDCLVCHRGYFLAIETKGAGKDLTKFQKLTRDEINAAQGPVLRVRDDLELEILQGWLLQVAETISPSGGISVPQFPLRPFSL